MESFSGAFRGLDAFWHNCCGTRAVPPRQGSAPEEWIAPPVRGDVDDTDLDSGSQNVKLKQLGPLQLDEHLKNGGLVTDLSGGAYTAPGATVEDKEALARFDDLLERSGIDTSFYGKGEAKPLELLYREAYILQHCTLEGGPDQGDGTEPLRRVVEQVEVALMASLNGVDHVLVSTRQVLHDNRSRSVKQLLLHKMREGDSWEVALQSAFDGRLRLSSEVQGRILYIDTETYCFREEEQESKGYPGLPTQYRFHDIIVHVEDPYHPDATSLGLPEGRSFATMEGATDGARKNMFEAVAARLNVWAWEEATAWQHKEIVALYMRGRFTRASCLGSLTARSSSRGGTTGETAETNWAPLAEPLTVSASADLDDPTSPNALLFAMMKDQVTEWERVEHTVSRLRDPTYSLRAFFRDCLVAFPELRLYLCPADGKAAVGGKGMSRFVASTFTSQTGRSPFEEYQRTIGALFAFYWLMRADLDGRDGFCYGVDMDWRINRSKGSPKGKDAKSSRSTDKFVPTGELTPEARRDRFRDHGQWAKFQELLLDAGLLHREKGQLSVNTERTKAMLALTAIHDVMKMEALIPKLAPEHAPFGEYRVGDQISDHDVALAYILECFPQLMPSYRGLKDDLKRVVLFTQAKMEFNNGWLVQAEGPPGKILSGFKRVLQQGGYSGTLKGGFNVSPRDIAFYFVHWLTDLAGAVPTPLAGSEKFVLHFPHSVLDEFLKSFAVVKRLAHESETWVFEDYLQMRWRDNTPTLDPLPTMGPEVVCRCRILCMAQGAAQNVLSAYDRLPRIDRDFLNEEMARTGVEDQDYRTCSKGPDGARRRMGPAFLLYYGPALLQKMGEEDEDIALQMLISILEAGRKLWPANQKDAGKTITLRIDTLKERTVDEVRQSMADGDVWLLVKHSNAEAFVERQPGKNLLDAMGDRKWQTLELLGVKDDSPRGPGWHSGGWPSQGH